MSELTPCNYCNLQGMRRRYGKEKKRIVIRPAGFNEGLGGHNIHAVRGFEKPSKKNQIGWMMLITGHCVC